MTQFPGMSGTPFCTQSSSSRGQSPEKQTKAGRKKRFVELAPELELEQQSPPSRLVIVDMHSCGEVSHSDGGVAATSHPGERESC